jgi:cbb3-type cytochrome oxidase subunit 1
MPLQDRASKLRSPQATTLLMNATAQPLPLYHDDVVRQFSVMTVAWGIVGMSVGMLIAAQCGLK